MFFSSRRHVRKPLYLLRAVTPPRYSALREGRLEAGTEAHSAKDVVYREMSRNGTKLALRTSGKKQLEQENLFDFDRERVPSDEELKQFLCEALETELDGVKRF